MEPAARGGNRGRGRGRGGKPSGDRPARKYRQKITSGEHILIADGNGNWKDLDERQLTLFQKCRTEGKPARSANNEYEVRKVGDRFRFFINKIQADKTVKEIPIDILVLQIPKPEFHAHAEDDSEDE